MALVRRQQIGDALRDGIAHVTFPAVQGAGDYLCLIFLIYLKFQLSLAHRTCQNIDKFSFHGLIIPQCPSLCDVSKVGLFGLSVYSPSEGKQRVAERGSRAGENS